MAIDTSVLISSEPWHLVGGTLDIWFDVVGDVNWTRQVKGRKATLLCGGKQVMLIRGITPWSIRMQVYLRRDNRTQRNIRMQDLEDAFNTFGQTFTLTQPGGLNRTVQFDPEVGIEERWESGARVITFGFVEVTP
jgi:hypothetical protein